MNFDDLPAGYRVDADGVARRAPTVVEQPTRAGSGRSDRSEKLWMARVQAAAHRLGWLTYHTHDSRRSQPGFPDLVLVRDRLLFAELKTDTGRLTAAQAEWLDRLQAAGAETHVWRPSDEPAVLEVLA